MTDQLSLGDALKNQGMARVDQAEDEDWKERADEAILELARKPSPFTAEDVREIAGDPSRPNAMGARLSANARRGLIRHYGFVHARRPERHSSLVILWMGMPKAFETTVVGVECESCGEVFGGVRSFEMHRFGGDCLPPAEMARRGLYRKKDGRWGREYEGGGD